MIMQRFVVIGMVLLTGAAMAQEPVLLEGDKVRLSYALGMNYWSQLQTRSVGVDPELFIQGFRDAVSGGKTRLTEVEAGAILSKLKRELQQRKLSALNKTPRENRTGQASVAAHGIDLTDIKVSFKLDPRLTRSLYMGDRWVSPPTYTRVQERGQALAVDARAEGLDVKGRTMRISPEWIPSDPGMVTVSPARDGAAIIVVKRAGESRLKVTSADVSRELTIKASANTDNTLMVEIYQ